MIEKPEIDWTYFDSSVDTYVKVLVLHGRHKSDPVEAVIVGSPGQHVAHKIVYTERRNLFEDISRYREFLICQATCVPANVLKSGKDCNPKARTLVLDKDI